MHANRKGNRKVLSALGWLIALSAASACGSEDPAGSGPDSAPGGQASAAPGGQASPGSNGAPSSESPSGNDGDGPAASDPSGATNASDPAESAEDGAGDLTLDPTEPGAGEGGGAPASNPEAPGEATTDPGTPETPADDPVVAPPEQPPAEPFDASFHIGADLTWVQHDEFYGATYLDTDGVTKDPIQILKGHGMNSIRLRAYVDPMAADGYDQVDGFGDTAHTLEMAQRATRAGMGVYVSTHLSDNWADPGKQCIPVAWQGSNLNQLAQNVYDYMFDLVTTLVEGGARPQLISVGNEITGGTLRHICDAEGLPVSQAAVNGGSANWNNLGTILRAGARAVRDVDSTILIVLHADRAGDYDTSLWWLQNAIQQGISFDVFADTAYVRWQGQPSAWRDTFSRLAAQFTAIRFMIPEYGNENATSPANPSTIRQANDIIFSIPNQMGVGTWFYEPFHPVQAGIGFGVVNLATDADGNPQDPWPVFEMVPAAMADYERMRVDFASRL